MRLILGILFFICLVLNANASTVHLKSGNTVEGEIKTMSPQKIAMEVNGALVTYFADEIKDIDGVAFNAPVRQGSPAASQGVSTVPAQKRDIILKFIDVFGTRAMLEENFKIMISQMPSDKPEDIARIKERIKIDELIERLIPIYDSQFSAEDLNAYIKFYSSPEGKKLIQGIPVLMQKSVDVSSTYIEEKFPELQQADKPSVKGT